MIGDSLAHLARERFFGAIHETRLAPFKGDAVDLLMSRLTERVQPRVVDNHCLRLIFADRAVQPVLLPVFVRLVPHSVKPEPADLSVILAEDFNALRQVIDIRGEILFVVGIVPVKKRMVEERDNSAPVAFVNEFRDQIPAARGMRRVEMVQPLDIIKRKTVVVAGRHGNISASRVLRGFDEPPRPALFDKEFLRRGVVLLRRHQLLGEIPLPFPDHAVKPEMIEHSEPELFEAFNILVCHPLLLSDCTPVRAGAGTLQFFPRGGGAPRRSGEVRPGRNTSRDPRHSY